MGSLYSFLSKNASLPEDRLIRLDESWGRHDRAADYQAERKNWKEYPTPEGSF
jgi:hypothetical protein